MAERCPPIEPDDHGRLDVGDGNLVYAELVVVDDSGHTRKTAKTAKLDALDEFARR